jgi:hypothetical protein
MMTSRHNLSLIPRINIYDCTQVNAWHLERMRTKARTIFNKIKRYIPAERDFEEYLFERIFVGFWNKRSTIINKSHKLI